jgi:cytochrome c oxidase subunit 2
MSRQTLASGAAMNAHDRLRAWIRDPQQVKVGCLMPNMQLSDKEVDQIVAYLETLK